MHIRPSPISTKVCQGAVEGLGGLFPEAWNKIAKQFVET